MEFWMFDVKFCPAVAGHAHAWILEEIAHAKSAKDGKGEFEVFIASEWMMKVPVWRSWMRSFSFLILRRYDFPTGLR